MADRTDHDPEAEALREPHPLRTMRDRPELDPNARRLGQALQDLAEEPLPEAPGWNELEEPALRLAQRRRWRFHLKEFWRNIGATKLVLSAAGVALILLLGTLGVRALGLTAKRGRDAAPQTPVAPLARDEDRQDELALEAGSSPAGATLRCGARLHAVAASVYVDQKDGSRPVIKLKRGRVAVQVPPMPSGGSLRVQTHDAEVIVHGTRFQVERREPEDLTVVSVEEGLVEVRPIGGRRIAVFLRAGEQLRVPSRDSYVRQLGEQLRPILDAGRCDEQASTVLESFLADVDAETEVSAALYLKGSCAAARGDQESALEAFEKVAASSRSPLRADNALARCAELRAAVNAADGALAWQRYLLRFPKGQHRESAQRYLQEVSPPRAAEP